MKSRPWSLVKQGDKSAHSAFFSKGSGLSHLSDSLYMFIDLSGKVIETNLTVQRMFGYTESEMVGYSFFSKWIVPNMGKAMVKQVLCDKLIHKFVADIRHKDGNTLIVSINACFVMDKARRIAGIECLLSDVTKAQQKEQEFDETLRNVSGGIAHLINNQMVAVVGTADLVKKQLGDRPELIAKLDRISKSGLAAGDVAHNLVEYSQTTDTGRLERVNLNSTISLVSRKYKNQLYQAQPRRLTLDCEPNIRPIMGDEQYIYNMVNYLLSNAVEATDDQGEIIISSKNVLFPKRGKGEKTQHVMLVIQDNGHGMGRDIQHRIFEPFFTTRFQGRGMGMAHTLKIVKKYDGHIHIKSGVGKGSVFTLHFPAAG